ncbi:MAG: NCS2 family permease [Angelakisella sp.]|jgi:AGZA family xanthine/uracil permease-like MFS transporter|nr:NCS2 family permease [Angelakisella sp.]MCI9528546.1 NCS2 family permease [Angelakisella sp.]
MEKLFHLKENGTTVRTEVVAGLTTFMTMAYIIALNPNLLTGFDVGSALWNGVFMATCLASALAMFCMAFLANKPFALAPGMGLNSFFAVVVANIAALTGMSYVASFQSALVIILIEGIVFIILSILNIREKIVDAIPLGVRLGIAPAIGLMLMNIGLGSNAGVYSETGGPFFVMRDFFGALTPSVAQSTMGSGYNTMVLQVATMFIGLFVIVLLAKRGVKGAVLLGMLAASVIYWAGSFALGNDPFASLATASFVPPFGDMMATTFFKFNFAGFLDIGWFTAITLVITFCMIDMFDTIGTLVGTASRAGMVDKDGNMPNMKEALLSDAIGTIAGACTGTSTVTTFVESASGVEAGGRTGLTALTTGVLFLACIFIAPLAAIIPAAATSAALIYVGVLMLMGLKNVNFDDMDQMVPVALMLIGMPVSSSIGHAIGLGLISYAVIKVFSGKAKEVSVLTYVISALFLLKFFLIV